MTKEQIAAEAEEVFPNEGKNYLMPHTSINEIRAFKRIGYIEAATKYATLLEGEATKAAALVKVIEEITAPGELSMDGLIISKNVRRLKEALNTYKPQ